MPLFLFHTKILARTLCILKAYHSFIFSKRNSHLLHIPCPHSSELVRVISPCLLHDAFIPSCFSPAVNSLLCGQQQISAPLMGQQRSTLHRKKLNTWRDQLCSSQRKSNLPLCLFGIEERIHMLASAYLLHLGLSCCLYKPYFSFLNGAQILSPCYWLVMVFDVSRLTAPSALLM